MEAVQLADQFRARCVIGVDFSGNPNVCLRDSFVEGFQRTGIYFLAQAGQRNGTGITLMQPGAPRQLRDLWRSAAHGPCSDRPWSLRENSVSSAPSTSARSCLPAIALSALLSHPFQRCPGDRCYGCQYESPRRLGPRSLPANHPHLLPSPHPSPYPCLTLRSGPPRTQVENPSEVDAILQWRPDRLAHGCCLVGSCHAALVTQIQKSDGNTRIATLAPVT